MVIATKGPRDILEANAGSTFTDGSGGSGKAARFAPLVARCGAGFASVQLSAPEVEGEAPVIHGASLGAFKVEGRQTVPRAEAFAPIALGSFLSELATHLTGGTSMLVTS